MNKHELYALKYALKRVILPSILILLTTLLVMLDIDIFLNFVLNKTEFTSKIFRLSLLIIEFGFSIYFYNQGYIKSIEKEK